MPYRGVAASVLLSLAAWGVPKTLPAQEAEAVAGADATMEDAEVRELDARLLRTWSGDSLTMIDGLAQVPLAMMAGATTGEYRFELTVFDASGTQLYRDSWQRSLSDRASAYVEAASSTMLEPFRFGVRPGEYEVEIRAYPTDAPSLGVRTRHSVDAYRSRPVTSDLFLADRVEPLDDEGGGSWSISRGGFGIAAVARTSVRPPDAKLYYYLELYGDGSGGESHIDVAAEIVDPTGKVVFATVPSSHDVPPGGIPYAGSLSVDGLPPGAYRLRLDISGAGESVVREAPFRMLERAVDRGLDGLAAGEEAEYFQSLSDEELEETFDGVGYLVTESERQAYQSLPPDAKRRYLTEFFARRDPSEGPGNEVLEEYIERVGSVRMLYGELVGTKERAPWTTDAGKIYLRFGPPDERVINHFPHGADTESVGGLGSLQGEAPYEIWGYHSTGYVYLFIQESQVGNWRMIFTTDPDMRSLGDWTGRVGAEALRDMTTKFGIQPR